MGLLWSNPTVPAVPLDPFEGTRWERIAWAASACSRFSADVTRALTYHFDVPLIDATDISEADGEAAIVRVYRDNLRRTSTPASLLVVAIGFPAFPPQFDEGHMVGLVGDLRKGDLTFFDPNGSGTYVRHQRVKDHLAATWKALHRALHTCREEGTVVPFGQLHLHVSREEVGVHAQQGMDFKRHGIDPPGMCAILTLQTLFLWTRSGGRKSINSLQVWQRKRWLTQLSDFSRLLLDELTADPFLVKQYKHFARDLDPARMNRVALDYPLGMTVTQRDARHLRPPRDSEAELDNTADSVAGPRADSRQQAHGWGGSDVKTGAPPPVTRSHIVGVDTAPSNASVMRRRVRRRLDT